LTIAVHVISFGQFYEEPVNRSAGFRNGQTGANVLEHKPEGASTCIMKKTVHDYYFFCFQRILTGQKYHA